MNEGINLLEPNKKTIPAALLRRLKTMRAVMVGLLFIVSVASVVLFILVAFSPLPALHKQEDTLRATLAQSKSDMIKYDLVSERASTIDDVLASRHTLDQTISAINSKLPNNANVTAIQVQSRIMSVTVESTSLNSLDTFINSMIGYIQAKKLFSTLSMTDLSIDSTTNAYSLTVQMSLL